MTIIKHCWECGPDDQDGCGTMCMLPLDHDGPHEWMRDDQFTIEFLPEKPTA